ncbi:hypothetical protein OHS18_31940 [Amycolatopsis sp. NBC_00355]|uniref:hypothetical protein n=1 Tax=Amycolatopsis sp. NBC_00355 TaxID=2975957 RepID=UPI002E26CA5B
MRLLGGIFAAACLLTCVTACTSGSTTAAPATTPALPSSTSTSKPKPTAPTFTPAASPAKLSAACPFLSSDELIQAIGHSVSGGAKETEPLRTKAGTALVCEYGGGQTASLFVGPDTSVARFVAGVKSECRNAVMVPGAGEAALHCESTGQDGGTELAVAKHSHGELRTAELNLYVSVGEDTYATLGKLLADRL